LCLIGLVWLRQDKPKQLTRSTASVFRALYNARTISTQEKQNVGKNPTLISLAMSNMEFVYGRNPGKQTLEVAIGTSNKHLLTIVPIKPLNYLKLFGPAGYSVVITEAGMDYAQTAYSTVYAEYITPAEFDASWRASVRQMRAMRCNKINDTED
jgi:hypothetical protein